jgi:hypothetical protein
MSYEKQPREAKIALSGELATSPAHAGKTSNDEGENLYTKGAKTDSPNSPLRTKSRELTHPDDTLELVLGMPREQVLAA